MDDLNRAVEVASMAVEATPPDHPDRAAYLNNLGNSLRRRFERTGAMVDLDRAIEVASIAVKATPQDSANQTAILSNLGNSLRRRFERTGAIDDLNRAVEVANIAVEATPTDYPDRARRLNNLGNLLSMRFERMGAIEELNRAVEVASMAVEATPSDYPDRAAYLNNLGNSLCRRFERTGAMVDLNRAVEVASIAVEATPPDHPDRAAYLNNLGNSLCRRFERTGAMVDLNRTVEVASMAVEAIPQDHPDRAMYSKSLGNIVHTRRGRMGAAEDLDRVAQVARTEHFAGAADMEEISTIISTTDTVFSRSYEPTHSSYTVEEIERDARRDLVKVIPHSAKMKQVFIWVEEQLQRQVVESTAEMLPFTQRLEKSEWMTRSVRNVDLHLHAHKASSSQDKQRFLQVVDETIRKDCAGRFDTDLCEATFRIVWQLQRCIKDELDGNPDLGSVLTISGDSLHSWAVSCREYVETTWSTLGMAFFEKLELALGRVSEAEASDQDLRNMQVNLVSFDAEVEGGSSSVFCKGTVAEISILAQLLSWIAATFRLPQTGVLSCSTVSFWSRNWKPRADSTLTYSLLLEPLQALDSLEEGTCWKQLFPSTVMAYGFPVPICPRTLGLQIPFGAMLELAEILYDVTVEDDEGHYTGVYLDGVLWTLYPTRYIEEGNTAQWHLIRKHTGKEVGQSLTPDHFGGPAWFKEVDLVTLGSATAILGYCTKVESRLGTESRLQQYQKYSYSKAKIEHPSPEASLGSASLGFSILGRATASLTASFKPRKGLIDAQKEAKDMSYFEVLARTEMEPVILFETEGGNERAWMVPQLSLILDLLNFWIFCTGEEEVKKGVKYAKLDSDGGAQAKEVLQDRNYANEIVIKHILEDEPDIRIGDMVKQIYGQILKRMTKDAESDEGARGTRSVGKTGIRGWDLLELTYLGGSIARRRDVQPTAHGLRSGTKPCWMPLAKMIPILVGQRMGELMTPKQTDQVCRHWYPLPGGFERNYLAASIRCLGKVATYYGNEACWELVDNLGWDFKDQSIFQPCVKCMEDPKLCTKHPQLLVKRTNKLQKKSLSRVNLPPFDLPQDGAIIFGEKRKDEKFLAQQCKREMGNNGVL